MDNKHDHSQTAQNNADLADEYPSPEAHHAVPEMDMSHELANQAAAQAIEAASLPPPISYHQQPEASTSTSTPLNAQYQGIPRYTLPQYGHTEREGELSNMEQISILRDFYSRNPNPGKKDLEGLAEKTGRSFKRVREYFRQRRNKLRGLDDMEEMDEPGRASGWLQVNYRSAQPTSQVSQLSVYHGYKSRFDPYSITTPLMGGQELIQLAMATFPGCEMAKEGPNGGEYVLKGMAMREDAEGVVWEKGVEGMVEPLRASTWLLSNYQNPQTPSLPANLTQAELYTSYATRFSTLPPQTLVSPDPDPDPEPGREPQVKRENRLLNPVQLINLTRMTFPTCEPCVDLFGKFVIKGLERRDALEKGWRNDVEDMFPFALATAPSPSDPIHPLTSLLKRKLAQLHPDASVSPSTSSKRSKVDPGGGGLGPDGSLTSEDRELVDGLKRFRGSALGKEVRDVCLQQ